MSTNRLSFLLSVLTTSLAVMLFKEYQGKPEVVRTKTETIVRMVDVPRVSENYDVQVEEIKSSLNKVSISVLILDGCLCVSTKERPCPGKCFKTGTIAASLNPLQY